MASAARKQDMPPPGGYQPLDFARRPAKQFLPSAAYVIAYFAFSLATAYGVKKACDKYDRDQTEQRSSMLALVPMLVAERDRAYLKQLRKNRDEEAELMKNVEGWKVGTWYGEPIYRNWPEDTLLPPNHHEFFAHSHHSVFFKWMDFRRGS